MVKILRNLISAVPFGARKYVRRIPFVASAQRLFVASALSGEEFAHVITGGPASGLVMSVRLPEDKAIWQGTYELALMERLQKLVAQDSVCYDIGGFRGYVSGVMALAGAKRVYVFEPNPVNVQSIESMRKMNEALPVTLLEIAVSEFDGTAVFQVLDDRSMGKLAESSFQSGRPSERELEVQCRSLDSLLAEGSVPAPALIKIDVEGAELSVLRGAREVLRTHRPKLAVEVHSEELATGCEALLREAGYRTESWSVGNSSMPRHVFAEAN